MELYELPFSDSVRLNIVDIEDYNIIGSFDPDAPSDIDYYGYRETCFKIQSAEVQTNTGWWPMHDDEVRYIEENYDSRVTLLVQDAIDKQNGEYDE